MNEQGTKDQDGHVSKTGIRLLLLTKEKYRSASRTVTYFNTFHVTTTQSIITNGLYCIPPSVL
jgi:hypothetical protein